MSEDLTLSALDDLFVHQIPEPVRHVGTSDRNFYDRHYFNVHACRPDFFVILGLGQYPNRATQDGFVSLREGDRQTTLRSSRVLGDRGDMSCGPLRLEVLEGLKRLRIVIEPNDSGIEADLIFHGTHAAKLEPRQVQRRNGRVIHDVMRYCQTANYTGWIKTPTRTSVRSAGPSRRAPSPATRWRAACSAPRIGGACTWPASSTRSPSTSSCTKIATAGVRWKMRYCCSMTAALPNIWGARIWSSCASAPIAASWKKRA
ncbi:MAG: hypothetical protein ABT05_00195 [Lautropia sp. SCN 66-9]|nr:MAG: hypothetical protein ABT05_00195 [Lautropia sp. SCN 66-9]